MIGNCKFRIDIKGDYALFTRPEMKVERVSYDCITPTAARGILKAIYWHNGLEYMIDRIYILNPIKFMTVKRNEVKSKIPIKKVLTVANGIEDDLYLSTQKEATQRSSLILKDVHYIIDAHMETNPDEMNEEDSEIKFASIFTRRLQKGQCFHTPYLGCREFPAIVSPCEETEITTSFKGKKDLGFMLYDIKYTTTEITPYFFRAVMKNGVIDLSEQEAFM